MVNGKNYWKSLDRLLDSPAVAELDGGEFPVGADVPPDEVSRRTFIELMGASFALAGLAGCRRPVEHIVPYVEAPDTVLPGVPKQYATTMALGTSAYGVVVETYDGRPVKVEGNDLHPSSRGAASVWMQASVLGLYDPDRASTVCRRSGDGALEDSELESFVTAWEELAVEHEADGGVGLAVLSETWSSPTMARLRAEFLDRFPAARWVAWEPVHDANVFRGWGGERPLYHLEAASVVVALDADLLHTESEGLAHARDLGAARSPDGDTDPLRLYSVEPSFTVTGANADHRVPLSSRLVPAFAAALASELGVATPGFENAGDLSADIRALARVMAADLRRAGATGLVVAGRQQPVAVHALCKAVNTALGAVGTTVTTIDLEHVGWGGEADLAVLVSSMKAGEISTLVMIGGNPVARAPGLIGFGEALDQVPHSIHLADRIDETSGGCEWFVPRAHFLEAWGDARSADGTWSVVQPLIAPLLGGVSDVELVATLLRGEGASAHDEVRATWQELTDGSEAVWRRALHDGVASTSPVAAVVADEAEDVTGVESSDLAPPLPAPDSGIELVVQPSRTMWDGRFANNSWLQELPDPVTRLTWTNAALMSPATAAGLGVETGEAIIIRNGALEAEVPVLVMPGQADGSVVVEMGFGERAGGRVAAHYGGSLAPLRPLGDAGWANGVKVIGTGRVETLPMTQEHWSMEGRDLVREGTINGYRAEPDFAQRPDEDLRFENLWPEKDDTSPYRWGMAIDLSSCIGCGACVIACQSENNIPVVGPAQVIAGREMHWLRIDRYFAGEPETPDVAFQPVPCMHCENAPCEQVCPVAATVHDSDGLNLMVYNRCIGTRYCSNNCPYKVRRFNFFNYTKDTPEMVKMANNPDVTVRSRGVMEKCTYCVQRITRGKMASKREGRLVADGEIRTACQQTCPTQAITFGNDADEGSAVHALKSSFRDYVMLAELNNRPRTSYLAKVRNPNPEWKA